MDTVSRKPRLVIGAGLSMLLVLAVLMSTFGPSVLSGLAKPALDGDDPLSLYSYETGTEGWSGSVIGNNPGGTIAITTTHTTNGVQALQINSLPDQGAGDDGDGGFFSIQPNPALDFSAYTSFKFDVYTPISATVFVALQTGGWANWVQSPSFELEAGSHTITLDLDTLSSGGRLAGDERVDAIHIYYGTVGTFVQDYIRLEGYVPPPTNTSTPTLGATATPMADLPGLRVIGPNLYDHCGEMVLLRGVNKMVIWTDINGNSFPEIAKTGANSVRIVWLPSGDPAQLDIVIQRAIDNGLIPLVGLWNTTGDWDQLVKAFEYWIRPDVVSVIQKYEKYLLVNIGNEAGNVVSEEDFKSTYAYMIRRMRQEGIRTPLVIDASGWGQNIDMLQAAGPYLLSIDPDHNLIFDVHTYWPYKWGWSDERVIAEFAETAALGIPFMIGEFGNKWDNDGSEGDEIPYQLIIQEAYRYGFGYYPWEWGPGNNPQTHLNMTDDSTYDTLHDWGLEVAVTDPFSILNTSNRPASILNGGICTGPEPTPGPTATPYNGAPMVSIVGPAFNAMFQVDDDVVLVAEASDLDGEVSKVEFYANEILVGEDTTAPFTYTLSVPYAGEYWFSAKATDDDGATALSQPTYAIVGLPPFFSINDSITGSGNFQFDYTGSWNVGVKAGRFHDDDHYSSTEDDCFTFRFIGTQVGMYVATAPHHGIAEITVDSGSPISVSLYSETAQDNVMIWESEQLDLNNHTVDVCVTGDYDPLGTGSTVSIDRMYVSVINAAPTIELTSPTFGAILPEGSDVTFSANASDSDGAIGKVQFYVNDALVGEDDTAPYAYTLTSAPTGEHWVYARAVDDLGAVTAADKVYLVVGTPAYFSVNDSITGTGNFQFEYTGEWTSSIQNGLFNDDQHVSDTAGDCYTLRFNGAQARIYTALGPNRGIASVAMDDGYVEQFDLYDIVSIESILIWESELLVEGNHILEVCVTGQKNAASTGSMVSVDRVYLRSFNPPPAVYSLYLPLVYFTGDQSTPVPTPTRTARFTPTPRGISTATSTATATATGTITPTVTLTPSATATIVPPNTRTPYPTSTATPTPTPLPTDCVPVSDVVVYDDATTWDNWSWGTTVDFANTDPVYAGTNSISVTHTSGWTALSLHSSVAITTTGIQYISFYAFGGTDGTLLRFYTQDSSDTDSAYFNTTIPEGTWTHFTVTLQQLGNPTEIARINFQDGGDPDRSTYYLDEIKLVGTDCGAICVPAPDVVVYDDATTWGNWGWSTLVDFANTNPVYAGTNSISVTHTGGWGALSLHNSSAITTTGYQYASFYAYSANDVDLRFYTQDSTDTDSAYYDFTLPGDSTWHNITVTLQQLGDPANIQRVNFQDRGNPGIVYFLDEIILVGTDCSTPAPTPVAYFYSDGLSDSWSWGGNYTATITSTVHTGANAIGVQFTGAYGALRLHPGTAFNTTGFDKLVFYAHPNGAAHELNVYIQEANKATVSLPAGDDWVRVEVLLSNMGNPTEVADVQIQDNSGAAQPAFFVDDITLEGTGTIAYIYTDSLLEGGNWSGVYSFADTTHTHTGAMSISAEISGGYGGFYISRRQGPLFTVGYDRLAFYIHPNGNAHQLLIQTRNDAGTDGTQVTVNVASGSEWVLVEILLSDLGNPTDIRRITIQDGSGAAQTIFYVDNILLLGN